MLLAAHMFLWSPLESSEARSLAKMTNFGLVPLIFFGGYVIGLSFPTRLGAEVIIALFFAFQSSSFLLYITF